MIVVIDGLRPDAVNARDTPNLQRLQRSGVTFAAAHAAFPTGTRVNAATIATGAHPGTHGIMNNSVYLPGMGSRAMSTQRAADLLRAQEDLGGRLVLAESLAEILAERGMRLAAVSSGSTGSSLLLAPRAPEGIGVLVNGAFEPGVRVAYPDDVNRRVLERFGPAPAKSGRTRPRDSLIEWTQRVLMDLVVPELAPDVVIDWFTEPDHTQHAFGAGSPEAQKALRNVDRQVGIIVSKLEAMGLAGTTDLFVLSDHGATRHGEGVDLERILVEAGLKERPDSDDVVVAASGACVQLHVRGRDPVVTRRLVRFLQEQPWTGALFTPARDPSAPGGALPDPSSQRRPADACLEGWVEGTFSLESIHLASRERPCDVVLTLAWTDEPNEFGVPGTDVSSATTGGHRAHSGHGGPSPWLIRSTCLAAGPSFVGGGAVLEAPVGQVDVVRTVLHLKGIEFAGAADGRVLMEALRDGAAPPVAGRRVVTTSTADGRFRAALQLSDAAGSTYLDTAWRLPPE
jgi:arylsulfatase A-like enzyme